MLKKELIDYLRVLNEETVPAALAAGFKPTSVNAREGLALLTKTYSNPGPEIPLIYDEVIEVPQSRHSIPVRLFHPQPEKALPVLIYYHGGGGMAGSVSVYDPIYRNLAKKTNHIVVAVEYRLAPENPYPQGEIDAYNALKYVRQVLDRRELRYEDRISIGGDSGGGALSTAVARQAQFDEEVKVENQVLIYPSVDYTLSMPSIEENKKGYLLETGKIIWYFNNYFQENEDRRKASPLFGDITDKMPPTIIFTAQYCPLRDEGLLYGEKIKARGVETEIYNLENMIHTFMNMDKLCQEECDFVYEKMSGFLNRK